jgi:hypothetical protein
VPNSAAVILWGILKKEPTKSIGWLRFGGQQTVGHLSVNTIRQSSLSLWRSVPEALRKRTKVPNSAAVTLWGILKKEPTKSVGWLRFGGQQTIGHLSMNTIWQRHLYLLTIPTNTLQTPCW